MKTMAVESSLTTLDVQSTELLMEMEKHISPITTKMKFTLRASGRTERCTGLLSRRTCPLDTDMKVHIESANCMVVEWL